MGQKADQAKPYRGVYYVACSFALWVVVEYLTVWHSKLGEWVALMPWVFVQYLAIVLIFTFFIFRTKWDEKRLFLLMLAVMYLFEFLWANPLLLNPITFIPASLLLASMWGFLVFMPLWLVRRELRSHKLPAILCLLWIPAGFITAVLIGN